MIKTDIPKEVLEVAQKLEEAGFEAHLVGGCVRDILLNREPKDWDIATNAKPEKIQNIFSDSVYENQFGTVGVKTESENPKLKVIEVTTYRIEGKYTDKRHPDEIKFAKTIEEDLSRRDFTINALALSVVEGMAGNIIDLYGCQKDLKNKTIRTVGDPEARFAEDALRLMRAVRFATELSGFSAEGGPASGWEIEEKTFASIKKQAGLLEMIAKERIRDEFEKLVMAKDASMGIELLEQAGLLKHIIPELREGINVKQNRHHIYTVWEHSLKTFDYSVKKNYSLEVRLASLFHDIAKPKTKRGEGPESTFYGHEVVSAKMAIKILDRLRFSKSLIEKVSHLVRYHMFYYNVGDVTEAGVRRFLARVGPENVDDFIKVREADRIGSGVPKAVPYKLRHLLFMIDKVKKDPILPKMLKLNGNELMELLNIQPGPKVGFILNILLEEVLDDPKRNDKEYLSKRAAGIYKLSDKELKKLSDKAKESKEEFESGEEEEMKKKYWVK
ncbi:MAG: HD domain-containing protein [Candidatus Wolfebacteria bacterium]|nr:HD domain-containing protein [Candidatus Wolfebacteria bacterium]